MATKKKGTGLIGKTGEATVIEIFAAMSNTDLNEGKGNTIDLTYHPNVRQATVAAIGIGVFGSNGNVEPRKAVRFSDGRMFLLAEEMGAIPAEGVPEIKFSRPTQKQIAIALVETAKKRDFKDLTLAERVSVGLDE